MTNETHKVLLLQRSNKAAPHITPSQDDLQRAADILNAGKKVSILIGAGAMDAGPEVTQKESVKSVVEGILPHKG